MLGEFSRHCASNHSRYTRDAHAPGIGEFVALGAQSPSNYDHEHEHEQRLMPEDDDDDENEDDWGMQDDMSRANSNPELGTLNIELGTLPGGVVRIFLRPIFKKLTPVRGRPLMGGPRCLYGRIGLPPCINPPTYFDHGLWYACDRCTRRKSAGPRSGEH